MIWMEWTSICSCKKTKPFIKYPRYGKLFVLPYIRSRLVFAQLAASAIENEKFDRVLIDLPYFFNTGSVLETALDHFPLTSSLIIKSNKFSHIFFSFVPNDAACIAAWIAKGESIPFECIDDSRLPCFPERSVFSPSMTWLPDDYLIFNMGLKEYFTSFWHSLNHLWGKASHMERYFTSLRVNVLGERLKKALLQGEKVLFICETSLWWAVKKWLDGECRAPNPIQIKWKDFQSAFVLEDPLSLWIQGLLDDYPLLVFKFWKALKNKQASSFDKLDTFKNIMESLFQPESLAKVGNPSIRVLVAFMKYLKSRMASHKRVIPHSTDHLFDCVKSCIGMDVATYIAERLLFYPAPMNFLLSLIQKGAFFMTSYDGIVPSEDTFELPDLSESSYYYMFDFSSGPYHIRPGHIEKNIEYWRDIVSPTMTRREIAELNKNEKGDYIRWTIAQDYRIHNKTCSYIKEKVTRAANTFRIRRSWGEIRYGIHWKATLHAIARGEEALYIKENIRSNTNLSKIDNFTPVVFLFSKEANVSYSSIIHDSNEKLRNMELNGYYPDSDIYPQGDLDMVYSVFYTAYDNEIICPFHLSREHLTSIAILYTTSSMGTERYHAITRQPKRYQCRKNPRDDKELKEFSLLEKGVAWAVKYAKDVVVVVHYPGWIPSKRLLNFAQKKGIRLECTSISCLSKRLVRRLRRIHFISSALKKHPEHEKIIKRFLNPL